MKIYYGLTEEESKQKILIYKGSNDYKYKGVNTSLEGLIKFIKDNNMESIIKYYTVLDSNIFEIEDDILIDKEYDMIAVKIPFEFEINNVNQISFE